MKVRADQLGASLARALYPVYVVCGDEPLLVDEAAALIRRAVMAAGTEERQSFLADSQFAWASWVAGFQSLSLFAARRLAELRLPGGKPGVEGARSLEAWSLQPPPETTLLLLLPRADRAMQAAKWFSSLDKAGAVVTVAAPSPDRLPAWIGERLGRHGLKADAETLAFLAGRVEGNLLAAHQEIEKLALLLPPGPVSLAGVRAAVVDVARFDASDLAEAFLQDDAARYCRIIDGLEAEGETPILAIWLLAQELRTLFRLACGVERGDALPALLREHRVWDSRQPQVSRILRRLRAADLARALRFAAGVDRAAKGLTRDDAWQMLKQLGLGLMGKAPLKDDYGY